MSLNKLATKKSSWLSAKGPQSKLVLSSRIRLARNISGFKFVHFCKPQESEIMYSKILSELQTIPKLSKTNIYNVAEMTPFDRHFLVERHLISMDLEKEDINRGVMFTNDEQLSIMINEEDHLRIQSIYPGFQPENAWKMINKLDDSISDVLNYAYTEKLGYLNLNLCFLYSVLPQYLSRYH